MQWLLLRVKEIGDTTKSEEEKKIKDRNWRDRQINRYMKTPQSKNGSPLLNPAMSW